MYEPRRKLLNVNPLYIKTLLQCWSMGSCKVHKKGFNENMDDGEMGMHLLLTAYSDFLFNLLPLSGGLILSFTKTNIVERTNSEV